ncbi:MAG: hypothetical protein OEW16_09545 [Gammaproteobacteria bacterium]|nr:hypothetical protein [Betaproteobacteria bacterium]MDH4260527.1 hypothetical protein [Gammaproteobacteria bacterium]MDH5211156.1 hypothetical protein [Betaproteobacteria bacterium]
MKDLYNEKIKVLAERNGWSLPHAKGYVDGETSRRRGMAPSVYAQVGIDDYCLGFRAGYYVRKNQTPLSPSNPAAPSGTAQNDASKGARDR